MPCFIDLGEEGGPVLRIPLEVVRQTLPSKTPACKSFVFTPYVPPPRFYFLVIRHVFYKHKRKYKHIHTYAF